MLLLVRMVMERRRRREVFPGDGRSDLTVERCWDVRLGYECVAVDMSQTDNPGGNSCRYISPTGSTRMLHKCSTNSGFRLTALSGGSATLGPCSRII